VGGREGSFGGTGAEVRGGGDIGAGSAAASDGGSGKAAGEIAVRGGTAVAEVRNGMPKDFKASDPAFGGCADGAAGGTAIVTVSAGEASDAAALSTQNRPWQCGQFT
jgi:hypothetical protein